ncbi:Proteoglycan 4 [Varanus komodoensis]|nr:Proteoglycan 4 [Varanus komodoensis]
MNEDTSAAALKTTVTPAKGTTTISKRDTTTIATSRADRDTTSAESPLLTMETSEGMDETDTKDTATAQKETAVTDLTDTTRNAGMATTLVTAESVSTASSVTDESDATDTGVTRTVEETTIGNEDSTSSAAGKAVTAANRSRSTVGHELAVTSITNGPTSTSEKTTLAVKEVTADERTESPAVSHKPAVDGQKDTTTTDETSQTTLQSDPTQKPTNDPVAPEHLVTQVNSDLAQSMRVSDYPPEIPDSYTEASKELNSLESASLQNILSTPSTLLTGITQSEGHYRSARTERSTTVMEVAITQSETPSERDSLAREDANNEPESDTRLLSRPSPSTAEILDRPEGTTAIPGTTTQRGSTIGTPGPDAGGKPDSPDETTSATATTKTDPGDMTKHGGVDNPDRTTSVSERTTTQTDPGDANSPSGVDQPDNPERTTSVSGTTTARTDPADTTNPEGVDNPDRTTRVTETTPQTEPGDKPSPEGVDQPESTERTTSVTKTTTTQTYDVDTTNSEGVDNPDRTTFVTEMTTQTVPGDTTKPEGVDKPDRTPSFTETTTTQTDPTDTGSPDGVNQLDNPETTTSVTEATTTQTQPGDKTSPESVGIPDGTPTVTETTTTQTDPGDTSSPEGTDNPGKTTGVTTTQTDPGDTTNSEGVDNPDRTTSITETTTTRTDPGGSTNLEGTKNPSSTTSVTETTPQTDPGDTATPSVGKPDNPDGTTTVTETAPTQIAPSDKPSPEGVDQPDNPDRTTSVPKTTTTRTDPGDTINPEGVDNPDRTTGVTGTTTRTDPGGSTNPEGTNNPGSTTSVTETTSQTDPGDTVNTHGVDKFDNPDRTTSVMGTTTTRTDPGDMTKPEGAENPDRTTGVTETTTPQTDPGDTASPDEKRTTETTTKSDTPHPDTDDKNDKPESIIKILEKILTKIDQTSPTDIDPLIPSTSPEMRERTPTQPNSPKGEPNTTRLTETTIITQSNSPSDTPNPDTSGKPDKPAKVTQTTTTIITESKPLRNSPKTDESDSLDNITTVTTTTTTTAEPNPRWPHPGDHIKSEVITKITRTVTTTTTATTTQSNTTEHPEKRTHDVTTNTKIDLVSDREPTKESPTNKNTNTTVTQVTTTSNLPDTSSSTIGKIAPYTSTTVIPTKRRVIYYPTMTYSTSTARLPERIVNVTTEYVQPEKIVTSLLYKDVPSEMNLCNRQPADGIVPLQNGSLAVFRGHYYWLLDGENAPSPSPRKITEVWGIPSPIDTVFSRCNCDGKTFFFKDSQYWRFTNDKMDEHYPKPIIKGFGGLNGKIVTALSVGKHRNRPESVYFFKKGGGLQQYTYKQEGTKKCKKKVRTVKYPMYKPKAVIRKRRRFERAVRPHQIFRSIRIKHYPVVQISHYPTGVLQPEVQVASYWRGFPKEINSVISIPNDQKPDGYDYYAFSKVSYNTRDKVSGEPLAINMTAKGIAFLARNQYGIEHVARVPGSELYENGLKFRC